MLDKAKGYQFARDWVGNGLVLNTGEPWRQRRKLLSPAFNFTILSTFKDQIEESCDILVKRLAAKADGRPVDIQKYPSLFSLDVICSKNAICNVECAFS